MLGKVNANQLLSAFFKVAVSIFRIMDENLPLLHSEIHDDKQVSKEMRAKLKEVSHFEKEILLLEVRVQTSLRK